MALRTEYDPDEPQYVRPEGVPPSGRELTDYSSEPGFAIQPQPERIVPRYFDEVLAALGRYPEFRQLNPAARHRRAWGVAQDYEKAVLGRRLAVTADDYVAQLDDWGGTRGR